MFASATVMFAQEGNPVETINAYDREHVEVIVTQAGALIVRTKQLLARSYWAGAIYRTREARTYAPGTWFRVDTFGR